MLLLIVAAFMLVLVREDHSAGVPQKAVDISHFFMLAALLAAGSVAGFFFTQMRRLARENQRLLDDKQIKDALINASADAYVMLGNQGQITRRQGAEKILNAGRLATLQDVYDALQPASAEKLQQPMRELRDKGEEFAAQILVKNSNRVLWLQGARYLQRGQPPASILWLRDISRFVDETKRQVEFLHQANSQLSEMRLLLEQAPFPMWLRGRDLAISWCNAAYAQAVGASMDEVLARQIELVPNNQRGKEKSLAEIAREKNGRASQQRHAVIDGQRRLLAITETCAGTEQQLLGYAIDKTQEAEQEAELKRHIKAHNDVLEQMAAPIAIYGADTRLKFYNRAYLKLWHTDENFLRTEPSMSDILEDLRARRKAPEQSDFVKYKKERLALFTSLIEPREDVMHLPDGTSLRIMAMPHPFGGIMFVHEDVTDKLALESSYNTLIAVQRETLDNLAEGIAVYGGDGKLKLYNPAYMRIWQFKEKELANHPHIGDLLEMKKPLLNYGHDWASFKKEAIAERLDRTTHAGRYERSDGSVIQYACVPLPDGAVLISYLDVTDSMRAEKALRETNIALAAADKLKSEFVANVSYQLRTPLNTIMGYAEILANGYFGALNERQLDYARTMMDASKKLLHLINDVLDLATIEAGRMALSRKPVAVKALLESALDMTAEWARQQSITLAMLCEDVNLSFEADEQRMKQVLFNLISNAIQYTPSGGAITLEAKKDGTWMAISITDNGMGIPPEDQQRIFGSFERANPEARQAGAGLGLSLVKSFIELHGGHIIIDSRKGHGTRITCMVPLKAVDQPALRVVGS